MFVILTVSTTVFYLRRFSFYFQMYEKISTSVATIVAATTAHEQQIMTYTNSDTGYGIWEGKV